MLYNSSATLYTYLYLLIEENNNNIKRATSCWSGCLHPSDNANVNINADRLQCKMEKKLTAAFVLNVFIISSIFCCITLLLLLVADFT